MSRKRAFTLIELLTVIAVITVLVGILIPVAFKVRDSGYRSANTSNLRQLGAAATMWGNENNGRMVWSIGTGSKTFHILLAPYLGQDFANLNDINRFFFNQIGQEPQGVWNNPADDFITRSGNYSDYAINIWASGWQDHKKDEGGNALSGGYFLNAIPDPSRVIWMSETLNCTRDLRADWGSMSNMDPSRILSVLYVDGHIEQREVAELTATTTRADYPWGWPGHRRQ